MIDCTGSMGLKASSRHTRAQEKLKNLVEETAMVAVGDNEKTSAERLWLYIPAPGF